MKAALWEAAHQLGGFMKFKKFMPVLALACVCAVGQADAAQDRLMMPEQPVEPLNVIEAEVAVSCT